MVGVGHEFGHQVSVHFSSRNFLQAVKLAAYTKVHTSLQMPTKHTERQHHHPPRACGLVHMLAAHWTYHHTGQAGTIHIHTQYFILCYSEPACGRYTTRLLTWQDTADLDTSHTCASGMGHWEHYTIHLDQYMSDSTLHIIHVHLPTNSILYMYIWTTVQRGSHVQYIA